MRRRCIHVPRGGWVLLSFRRVRGVCAKWGASLQSLSSPRSCRQPGSWRNSRSETLQLCTTVGCFFSLVFGGICTALILCVLFSICASRCCKANVTNISGCAPHLRGVRYRGRLRGPKQPHTGCFEYGAKLNSATIAKNSPSPSSGATEQAPYRINGADLCLIYSRDRNV